MKKKYWFIIIGVLVVVGLVIIRSCQPIAVPDEPPQVITLAPVNSITPTTKPQPTQTPVKPTSIPTMASSPTVKPKPTNTQDSQPQPTATSVPTKNPIQMINWEWISLKNQIDWRNNAKSRPQVLHDRFLSRWFGFR